MKTTYVVGSYFLCIQEGSHIRIGWNCRDTVRDFGTELIVRTDLEQFHSYDHWKNVLCLIFSVWRRYFDCKIVPLCSSSNELCVSLHFAFCWNLSFGTTHQYFSKWTTAVVIFKNLNRNLDRGLILVLVVKNCFAFKSSALWRTCILWHMWNNSQYFLSVIVRMNCMYLCFSKLV